jgi:sRNA-binding regulator protein Hfq
MASIQQPLFDKIQFDKLNELAQQRYGQLTEAETNVLRDSTSSSYPPDAASVARSTIAPEFLRWLVADSEAARLIDPKGIRIHHASIHGPLDLDGCHISIPMSFDDCLFEREVNLRYAQMDRLSITNSTIRVGINGELSTFHGSVFLDLLTSTGPLLFQGAQVAGDFHCSKTTVRVPAPHDGLLLDLIVVKGGVFLDDICFHSPLRIRSAQIEGNLTLYRSRVEVAGEAISLDRSSIKGGVLLKSNRFHCSGLFNMFNVNIGGDLDLDGANLTRGSLQPGGESIVLKLDSATIHGSILMTNGFQTDGTVSMFATHVTGDFNCKKGSFLSSGPTLHVDQATIQGQVVLSPGFRSAGQIRMFSTQIGASLDCSGADLAGPDECITLYGAIIKGDVFLANGIKCVGRVQMYGAQVGGIVDCTSAQFRLPQDKKQNITSSTFSLLTLEKAVVKGGLVLNDASFDGRIDLVGAVLNSGIDCRNTKINGSEWGKSLDMRGATINGDVTLIDGFFASAEVDASNAQIVGAFNCNEATFKSLLCPKMRLSGDLTLVNLPTNEYTLDLRDASVKVFQDQNSSWPRKNSLHLDGFFYQDLYLHRDPPRHNNNGGLTETVALKAADRIRWLRLQDDGTRPQPWLQLASLLDSKGDPGGAKQVRFAFSREQAARGSRFHSAASLVYHWIEEDPINVLWPILLLWLFGSIVFWRARRMKAMAPTDKDAFAEFKNGRPLPEQTAPFNPIIYTLENVLPVVKLGQDAEWSPSPLAKPANRFPKHRGLAWTSWLPGLNYFWLSLLRWSLILLGWALALILGAAIGSRFK